MATLTITVTEAVSLGDGSTDRGTTNTQLVTVDEVDHRIMDVGTSWTEIAESGTKDNLGASGVSNTSGLILLLLVSTRFLKAI